MDLASIAALAEQAGSVTENTSVLPLSDLNTLHIDGDYAAYFYAGNDETPTGTARNNMRDAFFTAATMVGVPRKNVVVHITDPMSDKGQRYRIGTVEIYQNNRGKSAKPKNWGAMRDYLQAGMPASGLRVVNWTDREADDGAAFMSTQDFEQGRKPAIHSRDKDWQMFPGMHLRWTDLERIWVPPGTFDIKDNEETQYGHKFFWQQMLMGDGTDNIPGLEKIVYINSKGKLGSKNCGPVCAQDNLVDATNNLEAYVRVAYAYEEFYGPGWELKFAEQAMLLWMRTASANISDYMQVIPDRARPALDKANQFIARRNKL